MSAHGDDARRPDVAEWPGEPDEARRSLLDLSVAAAGIGSFDWGLVTGTLSWDVRLIELFGYDAATFDRSIDAFNARLHPDDVDRVGVLLGRAIETVGEYSAEYRVVLPDGQQRWVAARGRALADESGAAVRLLGAAWDISVRREAQDRLAQLVESMAVGFIAMDTDWVMTHVNAEAERVTAMPRTRLLGRTLWEAFPATVGTEFEAGYRRAADTGRPVVFEAFYPEPLDVWVEVRAVPGDDDDRLMGPATPATRPPSGSKPVSPTTRSRRPGAVCSAAERPDGGGRTGAIRAAPLDDHHERVVADGLAQRPDSRGSGRARRDEGLTCDVAGQALVNGWS